MFRLDWGFKNKAIFQFLIKRSRTLKTIFSAVLGKIRTFDNSGPALLQGGIGRLSREGCPQWGRLPAVPSPALPAGRVSASLSSDLLCSLRGKRNMRHFLSLCLYCKKENKNFPERSVCFRKSEREHISLWPWRLFIFNMQTKCVSVGETALGGTTEAHMLAHARFFPPRDLSGPGRHLCLSLSRRNEGLMQNLKQRSDRCLVGDLTRPRWSQWEGC